MRRFNAIFGVIAFGTLLPGQASAQAEQISRIVPVTFTGVVSSTAADTLLVRQPDGSYASFQGNLPPLPYAQGDPVTISFNATLPTRAFYDSGTYKGQIAADGIYRITLSDPFYGGTTAGGIGGSTAADVTGPIDPALNGGQPTNTRMTIVYDYNADSYSIEGGGNFFSGAYASPGYVYDASAKAYIACGAGTGVPCNANPGSDPVLSTFAAGAGNDPSSIRSGNFAVSSTDPGNASGTGFFSWLFQGSWNLPQFGGGATQVPEPGMIALFGAANALLMLRRRRRR